MLVGAADPVIAPFFMSDRYTRNQVIATKAICQLSTHIPKVTLFMVLGEATFDFVYADHWLALITMGVAVLIGIRAGKRTAISEAFFRRAYRVLLIVLGLRLLVESISSLVSFT